MVVQKQDHERSHMYTILGEDGKEYGPASAEQIRQWIAEDRISGQTQARLEGAASWKSLAEFPEFDAALAAVPASLPPPPLRVQPALARSRPPGNGLATASVVLGVVSFFGCSILSGIPAIVTGHIARNRAVKFGQTRNASMALSGLIMGYISIALVPIMAGLLLPALAKAKAKAQELNCATQIKQIGLAARVWANDHNEKFPPDFLSMSNELSNPLLLICPADRSRSKATSWSEFGPENVTYEYLEPGLSANSPKTVVFRCPVHGTAGLVDGSIRLNPSSRRKRR
jgi:Domain of unknown function (DUF4190)/GYF domain 2